MNLTDLEDVVTCIACRTQLKLTAAQWCFGRGTGGWRHRACPPGGDDNA